MNVTKLLQQAQRAQTEMQKALAELDVEGAAGGGLGQRGAHVRLARPVILRRDDPIRRGGRSEPLLDPPQRSEASSERDRSDHELHRSVVPAGAGRAALGIAMRPCRLGVAGRAGLHDDPHLLAGAHGARVAHAWKRERDALEVEWDKLLLEQSAWATHPRIEQLARDDQLLHFGRALVDAQRAHLAVEPLHGGAAHHALGARAARFLTVKVTDDLGKPVPGALVSFLLPGDGPGDRLPVQQAPLVHGVPVEDLAEQRAQLDLLNALNRHHLARRAEVVASNGHLHAEIVLREGVVGAAFHQARR